MPWDKSDSTRFTKKAQGSEPAKKQWAATANAVLKKTGSDAQAVRIANAAVSKRQK